MSNLSSLFKGKKASGNAALRYERPSDPASDSRSRSSSQQASPAPAKSGPNYAHTGKASGLYKLDKKTNAYVGVDGATPPLGIAIVGQAHQYALIIYNGQNKRFVATTIAPGFKADFQGAQYLSFYDQNRDNWSVAFATPEDATKFAKACALVRLHAEYHTNKAQTTPFVLSISNTGTANAALAANDRVGVQYQLWTNTRNDPSSLPQAACAGTPHRAVIGSDIEKLVVGHKPASSDLPDGIEHLLVGLKKDDVNLLVFPNDAWKIVELVVKKVKQVNLCFVWIMNATVRC